jgi:hypothetical protein
VKTILLKFKIRYKTWYSYQINILVYICFHHNPDFDPYDEETSIFSEFHFYISYNRKHEFEFEQDCFKIHH